MTYLEKLKDPRWQKKRLEILNRDEWSCRICGDKETTLNIHHVAYSGEPWEADSNSLLTMCESCHKDETEWLKTSQKELIKSLKSSGFMSVGFEHLSELFNKDRGWMFYEPAFDILKMVIEDDKLWGAMHDEFYKRLKEKQNG